MDEQFLKLHDLIIGSTNVSGFLEELSIVAASTLSESAGSRIECGVTLRQRKRSATVAGSSDRARELDKLEQVLGQGPLPVCPGGHEAHAFGRRQHRYPLA